MLKQTIRRAARTVVFDKNNKVAILEVKNGDYHKIPGGGIDDGESEEAAAIREALEESGCDVKIVEKIGEQEFTDPGDINLIHHSVCYLAKKIKNHETSYFTEEEKKINSDCYGYPLTMQSIYLKTLKQKNLLNWQ